MPTITAASKPAAKSPSTLDQIYASVADPLQQVEQLLRQQLRSQQPYVDELCRYGCLLGGKRLRPVLVLLSAQACGEIQPDHPTLATVLEMIHTATLVHDDVLDGATTRRHLATVNSRWDNEASILLGDLLFSQAFYLASSLDDVFACRAIGRATNRVCEGELRQKGTRGDFRLTEAEYLSIIEAKTAELCACSCLLGAHYAAADATTIERLERYGRYLGIAFQIADDILDLVGREETTGKSLGTDLQQQKPTLPLIHLLQTVDAITRQQILQMATSDHRDAHQSLRRLLQQSTAIEYAQQQARHYAVLAASQLEGLSMNDALEHLHSLTRFAVHRVA